MSNVYCSAPWKGITIRENGDVKTCCVGMTAIGNLNNNTIEEILTSPALSNIRNDLLSGQNVNCQTCINEEKNNNYSTLRQHYLKHYPITDVTDFDLKFVDVRWNNKCNLACQYCEPTLSSTWEERVGIPIRSSKKNYQDELLQWMLTKSADISEIMLVGGEPMLMKQNHELLKILPQDCQISIITNLSYDITKLSCIPDLLSRPKEKIIWNVSAENTNEQFEYVRTGASWKALVNNLKFITDNWPTTVSVNMVYSILSATTLDVTIDRLHQLGVNKFTLMPIANNSEIDVFVLGPEIRNNCANVLAKVSNWHKQTFGVDQHLYPISGLEDVHNGLIQSTVSAKINQQEFFNKIKSFDAWAPNKKFQDLWPDVVDLIKRTLI